MANRHPSPTGALPQITPAHQEIVRLLVIPFLIYLAWVIEIFLLEGSRALFSAPDLLPLLLSTLVGCVLTGILVPVLVIRRSFLSGAVNMHQVGFRSLRRTAAILPLVAIPLMVLALLVTPGASRFALIYTFVLCLPTGISAVMICWVLIGTHIQAWVRAGGVVIAITTGVVMTAILFALATRVLAPGTAAGDLLVPAILLGMITAVLFFAVRDVYAAVVVITAGMSFLYAGSVDSARMTSSFPSVIAAALVALAALFIVHGYFSCRYSTVIVVADR